jgi:5'-nucleotidase
MRSTGYDVVAIGNHEFDFGPGKLADIISASAGNGAIPPVLLSNAVFSDEDPADDKLAELFSKGIIRHKLILERDGLRIGFFSLMGIEADENAAFAPPVTFAKQISSAAALVEELRSDGCDLVICLSHSGVSKDKKGNYAGEDALLAAKVKGIDVIISGHSHTLLEKPMIVNGVPIVQAGEYGQNVGKLTLTLAEGKITVADYTLFPVDDRIQGDPEVNALIEEQKRFISADILKPLGMEYTKPVAEAGFLLQRDETGDVENSNLGPLVADAIHSYVNRHVEGGADLSVVAVGVIRDNIVPGVQTAPDIFRIMSMGSGNDNVPGYPLSKCYVTGRELKNILEVLVMAGKSAPSNYCYYSGIMAGYDPGKGFLRKIRKIEIIGPDGSVREVSFSKKNPALYSVVANSYMLELVGTIKKMSKGLINVVPKDAAGKPITDMKTAVMDFDRNKPGIQEGKEWLAIAGFLSSMKDTNGNSIPDIEDKYRVPVRSLKVSESGR